MHAMKSNRVSAAVLSASMTIVLGGPAGAQVAAPRPPAAASPPMVPGAAAEFGRRGQIAISGELKGSILHQSAGMNGDSYTNFEIQPSLDYFVSPNLSVGGLVGIRRESQGVSDSLVTFTIGPRVGYDIVLSGSVSLWVRAGLGYAHLSRSLGQVDESGYVIHFSLFAPLLWHPVTHLFLGAGPFLETDLVSRIEGQSAPRTTDIGLSSTVGGYFGGL